MKDVNNKTFDLVFEILHSRLENIEGADEAKEFISMFLIHVTAMLSPYLVLLNLSELKAKDFIKKISDEMLSLVIKMYKELQE
jgi:hypothetical protein